MAVWLTEKAAVPSHHQLSAEPEEIAIQTSAGAEALGAASEIAPLAPASCRVD